VKKTNSSKIGLVFCLALAAALCGCSHSDHSHHHSHAYSAPPPVYVEGAIRDGYIYYPSYQVYYSSSRRQFIYRDGRTWVARSSPPGISVRTLLASPSVRLNFYDAPEIHHDRVVKQYPKNWKPPGWEQYHRHGKQYDGYAVEGHGNY